MHYCCRWFLCQNKRFKNTRFRITLPNCLQSWPEITKVENMLSQIKSCFMDKNVEPQISHFANFTPCEELVPKRHFLKMWNLRKVNFDSFGGLTSVLKLNFASFSFSTVKNWYVFASSAKDWFDFSQMWRIGTQFSQMWRIGTSS